MLNMGTKIGKKTKFQQITLVYCGRCIMLHSDHGYFPPCLRRLFSLCVTDKGFAKISQVWGWIKIQEQQTRIGLLYLSFTAKTLFRNLEKIFLERKLRGLSPNFYIHISVSDLYTPTIGLPIWWTDRGNI
jgi:hypothetical protein